MSGPMFTPGSWAVMRSFPDKIVPATHVERHLGGSIHEHESREYFALVIATAEYNEFSVFSHKIPKEQARANAHLIAAAPELYEALDYAIKNIQGVADGDDLPSIVVREKGIAALRKARGEPA